MKRIIMTVVGAGLTWMSAAVGICLHERIFNEPVADAEINTAPIIRPDTPPAPAAETKGARQEPIVEHAAKPPDEVEISCRAPRFRAIRRAVREYCRAPADDEDRTFLCPRVTEQLRSCRSTPSFSLLHERECHAAGGRTICHEFRATLPSEDEIIPFIALDRPAGRWKVLQLEYDDLERP